MTYIWGLKCPPDIHVDGIEKGDNFELFYLSLCQMWAHEFYTTMVVPLILSLNIPRRILHIIIIFLIIIFETDGQIGFSTFRSQQTHWRGTLLTKLTPLWTRPGGHSLRETSDRGTKNFEVGPRIINCLFCLGQNQDDVGPRIFCSGTLSCEVVLSFANFWEKQLTMSNIVRNWGPFIKVGPPHIDAPFLPLARNPSIMLQSRETWSHMEP